jgi:hypothetical protein
MTPTRSRRLLLLPGAAVLALSAAGLAQAGTTTPEPPASAPPATMAPATEAPAAPGSAAPGSEAPASAAPGTPGSEAPASAAGTSGGGSSGAAAGGDLSGVCPATISIQTDWNPEAEHGWLYQMIGPDPTRPARLPDRSWHPVSTPACSCRCAPAARSSATRP